MKSRFAFAGTLTASLLLVACGGDAAPAEGDDAREASGEVLEGTISDEMLPIEELRSQAPLAAPEPGEGDDGDGSEASGDTAAAETAEDAPAEPPAEASAEEPSE